MASPNTKHGILYGVGINDADYVVKVQESYYVGGKRKRLTKFLCPFYAKWVNMLQRCYCERFHKKQSTYRECFVCEGWLTFSNFKGWMEQQDWEGKQLDKDLRGDGGEYSPETCTFLLRSLNQFLTIKKYNQGDYLIGVSRTNKSPKYYASIINDGRKKHLGVFEDELEAHKSWQKNKIIYAQRFLELEDNIVTKEALANLISKLTHDYNNDIPTRGLDGYGKH